VAVVRDQERRPAVTAPLPVRGHGAAAEPAIA
jgi:hypothetical protein